MTLDVYESISSSILRVSSQGARYIKSVHPLIIGVRSSQKHLVIPERLTRMQERLHGISPTNTILLSTELNYRNVFAQNGTMLTFV